ncbi:hypothetical protein J4714_13790 [Staphylococcus epidermidis]|nr:hypothetical protein [Staphylococcus epidermidis]
MLTITDGKVSIEDLRSTNGTMSMAGQFRSRTCSMATCWILDYKIRFWTLRLSIRMYQHLQTRTSKIIGPYF